MCLLRDCYVMLRQLCYVRCTNRMGKMTPDINPKLTRNPKPELYRVVWAKLPKTVPNRPKSPKSRGRVDRMSRLNRIGL